MDINSYFVIYFFIQAILSKRWKGLKLINIIFLNVLQNKFTYKIRWIYLTFKKNHSYNHYQLNKSIPTNQIVLKSEGYYGLKYEGPNLDIVEYRCPI